MFLHSCYKAVFKWMVWVSLPCASATYNHMEANQLLFVRGTFLTWLFFDTQYSCKKNYSKFFFLDANLLVLSKDYNQHSTFHQNILDSWNGRVSLT